MKKVNIRSFFTLMLFATLIIAFTIYLYADADGITGRTSSTSQGCGGCHGSSNANVNLSVASQSGSFTVLPNSVTTFTVTLAHPSLTYAGVNIGIKTSATETPGVNAGSLSPVAGSGLKTAGNPQELTQTVPKPLSGGSVSFSFNWTAPSEPGTYYLRAIGLASNNNGQTSGDEWNWMQVKEVIVSPGQSVTLTYPNGGEELCMGSKIDITWNFNQVSFVKIELSPNDGEFYPFELADNYPASTRKFTWTIPTTLDPGNTYRIKVSDASNPTINDPSNSSFTIMPGTSLTKHPEKQTVCEGNTAVFSTSADGINLRYQWYKNGTMISGATLPTYYVNNPKASDVGFYKVRVTGDCGSPIFSDSAKLELNLPPKIIQQPETIKLCLGQKATFTVKAEGFNLFIRWRKNGVNIDNATGDTYTIENVKESDAGLYSAHITGACPPTLTTDDARLSVDLPPTIITQPQDQFVDEGTDVTFTCDATGTLPDFQWQKNGDDLPNEMGKTLIIKNVKESDAGNYTCVVKTICGTRTSRPAKLTIRAGENYAVLTLSNSLLDFGSVNIGTSKDTLIKNIIKNTGNIDLVITQSYISGSNADEFEILNLDLPLTVKPNELSDLTLKFQPITQGNKSAQLNFVSNSQVNPTINLSGNVINSVNDNFTSAFIINPNPAGDYILISNINREYSNKEYMEIMIYNSIGETLYNRTFEAIYSELRIDITNLPTGAYFLRLKDKVMTFVKIRN